MRRLREHAKKADSVAGGVRKGPPNMTPSEEEDFSCIAKTKSKRLKAQPDPTLPRVPPKPKGTAEKMVAESSGKSSKEAPRKRRKEVEIDRIDEDAEHTEEEIELTSVVPVLTRGFLNETVPKRGIGPQQGSISRKGFIKGKPQSAAEAVEEELQKDDKAPGLKLWGTEMDKTVDYRAAMRKICIIPTLRMDIHTLDLLGIREEVEWYLTKLGLSKFMRMQDATYESLTQDFLSTVTLAYQDTEEQSAGKGVLSFRIGRQEHSFTIAALCKLFGFIDHDRKHFEQPPEQPPECYKEWWDYASEDYVGGKSKSARITHPAIRYVHRLIASTLFGRTDTGTVLVNEFYLLREPFIDKPQKVNLGSLLAQSLVDYKHHAAKGKKVSVGFGGIITAIMVACKVDLRSKTPMGKKNHMDLSCLQRTHFLSGWVEDTNQFGYLFTGPRQDLCTVLLPNAYIPSLRSGDRFFEPTGDQFFESTPERPKLTLKSYFQKQKKKTAVKPHRVPIQAPDASEPMIQPPTAPLRTETDKWFYATIASERERTARLEQTVSIQSATTARLEKTVSIQSAIIAKLTKALKKIAPPNFFRHSGTPPADGEPSGFSLDFSEDDDGIDEVTSRQPVPTSTSTAMTIYTPNNFASLFPSPSPSRGRKRSYSPTTQSAADNM